ncbi:glycine--tRNA ligase subunit beta [Helicobacter cholecystus]|uniref:glycine--tRNA ligase subunit beta n=1 Tax=Helicobacter cholecystus TaxID=45498 RepID=UPI0027398061|nr:glycine--tRNA ligase subunit beta [Helicobacter cholecystus]
MKTEVLIEILSEELPAIPFLKEEPNILQKWNKKLEEYFLSSEFEFFYTPRRMVLLCREFPLKQEDQYIELFGPPVEIAYIDADKSKGLSKAGEGFVKKCGEGEISTINKEGKEVLYFSRVKEGRKSCELLPNMIKEWLESLNFGKSMRWGDLSESFVRPIHNIAVLFGGKGIEFEIFGIRSRLETFVHRDCGFEPREFKSIEEFKSILLENGITLDPKQRESKILKDFKALEVQYKIEIEIDAELLAEVVAITEYPRALLGVFDEEFLSLPQEVIITSMKENQRYFAIYKEGKLYNGFIVVINSMSESVEQIIKGNQKVLRARLSDAMFFYHNDLKRPLQSYDLSRISFVEGLGSIADKVERESKIAEYLFTHNACNPDCLKRLLEAVKISKSDLLCEMVGEFPELQGVMGKYYALEEMKKGIPLRDEQIAKSIAEQYLPNGEGDRLPSDKFSSIVALSYRLDSIFALFSIGKIPSGSKDPFALRRSGNAIIRIINEQNIALSLHALQEMARLCSYTSFDIERVWGFLLERIEGVIKINASILRSVIAGKERELGGIIKKALALNEVFEGSDKEALISTFKRVANITKDMKEAKAVCKDLLEVKEERELLEFAYRIKEQEFANILEYIQALFTLKTPLEVFFDHVMVNVENEVLRENRKALIYEIYEMFLEVGDIKEIAF